jgi:D-cysteine desulfhydrase
VGGSNSLGTWGYLEFVNELQQQSDRSGVTFDDIIMACGSGATTAGIALGCHLASMKTKVHGYGVCDNPDYFYNFMDKTLFDPLFNSASITQPKSRDIVRIVQSRGAG